MRHVEREEEEAAAHDPEGLQLHLCIINLVIGTLYCSKVGWHSISQLSHRSILMACGKGTKAEPLLRIPVKGHQTESG